MKTRFFGIAAIAVLSFCSGLVLAHHSTDVYFDLAKTYVLRGVVSSVVWQNPHMYAFMDVTTCKADKWAVELGSPNTMMRAGVTRDTIQKGMPVSILSSPAKFAATSGLAEVDEAWKSKHLVLGGCITLPNGRKIEYGD